MHYTVLTSRSSSSTCLEMRPASCIFLSVMLPLVRRPVSLGEHSVQESTCTVIYSEPISCKIDPKGTKSCTTNSWSGHTCSPFQLAQLILMVCTKKAILHRRASGTNYSPVKQEVIMRTLLIERDMIMTYI